MARKLKSDKWLFTATLVLVCASLVMVYSASAMIAMDRFHKSTYFLFKQATFALVGLVLMAVLMKIDYRRYRQPAVIWTATVLKRRFPQVAAMKRVRVLLHSIVGLQILLGIIALWTRI